MSLLGRPEEHLSVADLWEYRSNRRLLTSQEFLHLGNCNNCLSVLGLSVISKNFAHLERLVKEHDGSS